MAEANGGLSPDRALARLRQLAVEQRAAVARNDVEMLGRIAALTQSATAALGPDVLPGHGDAAAVIGEIQAAYAESIALLRRNQDGVRRRLQQTALTRRSLGGYGQRAARSARSLDGHG
jgi:hypothetical protein